MPKNRRRGRGAPTPGEPKPETKGAPSESDQARLEKARALDKEIRALAARLDYSNAPERAMLDQANEHMKAVLTFIDSLEENGSDLMKAVDIDEFFRLFEGACRTAASAIREHGRNLGDRQFERMKSLIDELAEGVDWARRE